MEKATRSILVIEDDKATLNKIKNQLKELNYKVACVMTAQEGVDYCIKNIVDLILLDLGLPDKDGMYVIETVRSFNNTLPKWASKFSKLIYETFKQYKNEFVLGFLL